MKTLGKLVSVRIGKVRQFTLPGANGANAKTWRSAIDKDSVTDYIQLDEMGLEGDQHADLVHHGGRDKAVLAYASAHYENWREERPSVNWEYGGFGENLTVEGATEEEVCLGDIWELGDVRFEVSQPREPCGKMVLLHQWRELPKRMIDTSRTGWYLRVVKSGRIRVSQTVRLVERPHPEWTIARLNRAMNEDRDDMALARELAEHETLAEAWRKVFRKRVAAKDEANMDTDESCSS